ncbi:four helix bundle protein [Patescibacteria group bacterium]|nr:four helix bundle protein [Patescibacteria group bacterium]
MQQATRNKQQETKSYQNLMVFKEADKLVLDTYHLTSKYPKSELFSLTSQMRRAAISVPANIAEGYTRRTDKEKLRFLDISLAPLVELEYYFNLSLKLSYITNEEYEKTYNQKDLTGKLLSGLKRKIRGDMA